MRIRRRHAIGASNDNLNIRPLAVIGYGVARRPVVATDPSARFLLAARIGRRLENTCLYGRWAHVIFPRKARIAEETMGDGRWGAPIFWAPYEKRDVAASLSGRHFSHPSGAKGQRSGTSTI